MLLRRLSHEPDCGNFRDCLMTSMIQCHVADAGRLPKYAVFDFAYPMTVDTGPYRLKRERDLHVLKSIKALKVWIDIRILQNQTT
jgi:hypothetical protein